MLFAVIFTDKPGSVEVRSTHLRAHIDWLEAHKELIPLGGSLRHARDERDIALV